MSNKKSVYTPEVVKTMTTAYQDAREQKLDNNDAIAKVIVAVQNEHEVTLNVVMARTKLSSLKVYTKDAQTPQQKRAAIPKITLVRILAEQMGVDYDEVASLDKANRIALLSLINATK